MVSEVHVMTVSTIGFIITMIALQAAILIGAHIVWTLDDIERRWRSRNG